MILKTKKPRKLGTVIFILIQLFSDTDNICKRVSWFGEFSLKYVNPVVIAELPEQPGEVSSSFHQSILGASFKTGYANAVSSKHSALTKEIMSSSPDQIDQIGSFK